MCIMCYMYYVYVDICIMCIYVLCVCTHTHTHIGVWNDYELQAHCCISSMLFMKEKSRK